MLGFGVTVSPSDKPRLTPLIPVMKRYLFRHGGSPSLSLCVQVTLSLQHKFNLSLFLRRCNTESVSSAKTLGVNLFTLLLQLSISLFYALFCYLLSFRSCPSSVASESLFIRLLDPPPSDLTPLTRTVSTTLQPVAGFRIIYSIYPTIPASPYSSPASWLSEVIKEDEVSSGFSSSSVSLGLLFNPKIQLSFRVSPTRRFSF